MEKNHHDRNSHIYTLQEIKRYNLRPETHHVTVRVNNDNNNYAPLCKEACKLTHLSIQCCHITWQKNEKLERLEKWTEHGELIIV